MTYAAKQDLVERYGAQELEQLTDHSHTGGIDDDVVNRALADADAEINGYLTARYTLPLADTPPLLKRLACEIAYYLLFRGGATELAESRYKAAVATLKGLSAGSVSIGLNSAGTSEPGTEAGVEHAGPERIFTGETLDSTELLMGGTYENCSSDSCPVWTYGFCAFCGFHKSDAGKGGGAVPRAFTNARGRC